MRELAPDVVLLDGGFNASLWSKLSSAPDAPEAVVLLESVRRAEVLRILQSGVRGLLLREAQPEEIAEALVAGHHALAVMSPEVLDVLVPASAKAPTADEPPPGIR